MLWELYQLGRINQAEQNAASRSASSEPKSVK